MPPQWDQSLCGELLLESHTKQLMSGWLLALVITLCKNSPVPLGWEGSEWQQRQNRSQTGHSLSPPPPLWPPSTPWPPEPSRKLVGFLLTHGLFLAAQALWQHMWDRGMGTSVFTLEMQAMGPLALH